MRCKRAALALALFALLAAAGLQASEPARAVIDCGTLEGAGVIRLIVDGVVYRVDIDCGRRT